jgi:RimJ/RimL family protein N-acetyltransferase
MPPPVHPDVDSKAPRVRLAPLTAEHLPHVMTWVNDREVMQYFANRQSEISPADERRYLEELARSPNDRVYSVFTDGPEGEGYVGQVSLNQIYWPAKNARLFAVVRRERQGQGLGTASVRALMQLAFGELGLRKVWLIVRSDNRSAQAMYLRLGFDFEGVLREEYCVGGRFYDMVRMASLAPP